ncbi:MULTISPECIES: AAA family ATPase [Paenibacillus]|uniref:AAA family ATPase n=1 Tax=Paenibacillus TaxID=44249 RepID=UPI0004F6B9F0|nr:AAA family ATPase [Paenibacillus odorifer]AIQ76621.1 ATP-binding protein [Paenibacillus odorifer]MEC0133149.1 AAA family ATPase [Paenibacillus odorifer]MEC0225435.1 AAA family ATPase [Paenibacillus odorifer]OMD11808.1 ATP-binding protein [Paenibacillus odorifer]OMD26497.1 ATP-binding protein [Paenibacillus odorifer]
MFFLQMSGYPGSGKSSLARVIAQHTSAVILDHDIVKSSLMESLGANFGFKEVGEISYDIEWALIDFHLSQGHNVILDSPCLYSEMIERGLNLTQKYNAEYKYVECLLNDYDELNNRLRNRKRMISQIERVPSEETLLKTIENAKKPSNVRIHIVNTKEPIESYIKSVIEYLNA